MRQRCLNDNNPAFRYYGGRGIRVCERWASYAAFLEDMGEKPIGTEIDRIDNDGNYEPANCRWATKTENIRNRPFTRRLSFCGESKTLVEWAESTGITYEAIRQRLKAGWSAAETLTIRQGMSRSGPPVLVECNGRTLSIADWSKETGVKATTIAMRLARGWDADRALFASVEGRHAS
jgi:hypothetical protein